MEPSVKEYNEDCLLALKKLKYREELCFDVDGRIIFPSIPQQEQKREHVKRWWSRSKHVRGARIKRYSFYMRIKQWTQPLFMKK